MARLRHPLPWHGFDFRKSYIYEENPRDMFKRPTRIETVAYVDGFCSRHLLNKQSFQRSSQFLRFFARWDPSAFANVLTWAATNTLETCWSMAGIDGIGNLAVAATPGEL